MNKYRTTIFGCCRKAGKVLLIISIFLSSSAAGYSQGLSCQYLIELGEGYFEEGKYDHALHYFRLAQLADPSCKEAIYYINLIKREVEGRVVSDSDVESLQKDILIRKKMEKLRQKDILMEERARAFKQAQVKATEREQKLRKAAQEREEEFRIAERQREEKIKDMLDTLEKGISRLEEIERERELTELERKAKERKLAELDRIAKQREAIELKKRREVKKVERKKVLPRPPVIAKEEKKVVEKIEQVYLAPLIKEDFPLTVKVSPQEYFVIKSPGAIKRFLVVTPGKISVEKIDDSSLKVTGKNFGPTFLHVWDDEGRWTFNVKTILRRVFVEREKKWKEFEGFKVNYSSNWRQYYRGRRFGTMEKRSQGFNQSAKIRGPTPYGDVSASMNWTRLGQHQEVTGYSAGLSKGHLLGFEDFNIRMFDVSGYLSPLSLPGKSLHGVVFDSPAFNRKLDYRLVYGKERETYYGFISPGVFDDFDSYIEGIRVGFLPDKDNKFYFNFARGYGNGRSERLKDKAFSLQSEHRFDKLSLSSEIATDEDRVAATFSSSLRLPKLNLRYSFYNIEKDFMTITGRPANRGKIGSRIGAGWRPTDKLSLSSGLNVYKDRLFFKPDKRGELNYEWDNSLNYYIDSTSSISNYIYYVNTPGLSSPQRNFNLNSTYNKRFNLDFFGKRPLSTHLRYSYQKNRSPLSPSSDYDRQGLSSGLRMQLIKDMYCFLNYDLSRVKGIQSAEVDYPHVMETGIDYNHSVSPLLSYNLGFSYRDEEKADSRHSFLSGEDSISGNIGLTYKPAKDAEFFVRGNVRNVWAENPDSSKFIEGSIRMGTRLGWDNIFSWAPRTTIEGVVFKDSNANGIKDEEEEGIEGVGVTVGPREVSSDKEGRFKTVVKLKSLVANIDFNTIPEAHILTTPSSLNVDTSKGGVKNIYFGLSTQSGIYGVIFYDANDNGKLDKEDFPVSSAAVILDNKQRSVTNNRGVYFFPNVMIGKHTLTIDINSLPIEYLPKISIKKEIEVLEGVTYTHHVPLRKRSDK